MSTYQPAVGELVDVTITGARVALMDTYAYTLVDNKGRELALPRQFAGATLAAAAVPAQWPPQIGDIWEDREGDRYFAIDNQPGVGLVEQVGGGINDPDDLHEMYGPLRLIYCEDLTRGGTR